MSNQSISLGFLRAVLAKILNDKTRDDKERIKVYFCTCILPRYDEIKDNYHKLSGFSQYSCVEAFFSQLFNVKEDLIKDIVSKIEAFKNLNSKQALQACLMTSI
ncbi:hypothetical protein DMB95_00135 [Campylobacter sp. MIT 12-8780]|uniref:hypothetical protein n=1 Tax=unclassified Campylobacter TaxID=2593542 RepID=UPI00115CDCCC|nr:MULTISPECIES: hypothetical protein [unclassified Campylobacter]NDJ26367.1 hypothetical protein [Campylobacter sp. MIT 19-121]TQR42944.1 hypothetical protein DMB95_00135 [Campylobacter sp. MIT 12-8780]